MTVATHRILIVFHADGVTDEKPDVLAKKLQDIIVHGCEQECFDAVGPLRQPIRPKKTAESVQFVVDFEFEQDAKYLCDLINTELEKKDISDNKQKIFWTDETKWGGCQCVSAKLQEVFFLKKKLKKIF